MADEEVPQKGDQDFSNPTYVSDDDLASLTTEMEVYQINEALLADKMLKENLPMAIQSVANLARSANAESVRMAAARYIVDRNLGKIIEKSDPGAEDSWQSIIGQAVDTPNKV